MYFDNHSTTPVDPEVVDVMIYCLKENFGNSQVTHHRYGWDAQNALEEARKNVAALINAHASEIIFTSGATESNNLAILGYARANKEKGDHIIVSAVEHKSVLNAALKLKTEGFKISVVECDQDGFVNLNHLKDLITEDTLLVSIQAANNEIGTLQNLEEISKITQQNKTLFHCDLSQAASTLNIDKNKIKFDLATWTAHKMYGPKGIGALFIRKKSPSIKLEPLLYGGEHERGLRSGTHNMPAIVGFGHACKLAVNRRAADYDHLLQLRNFIVSELENKLVQIKFNGSFKNRLAQNIHFTLPVGMSVEEFLKKIEPLCVSTGAACSTAQIEPSHVLAAIGLNPEEAQRSIRLGLGRQNTMNDAKKAVELIVDAVKQWE